MNLDLMVVLSMRQKEMAYQQQSARLTPAPPAFFTPTGAGSGSGSGSGAGTPLFGGRSSQFGLSVAAPLSPGFGKHARGAPRGSVSPLSVGGQLPFANTYDQFGYTWHWIAGVCAHFALQRQSAHFAVQYAHIILRRRALLREHDAYSIRNYDDVFAVQRELQLLGLTCVFMAAKIEEVHPPKATDLAAFLSKQGAVTCAGDDLVRYEGEYLVELNWNLHPVTPLSWLLFLLAGDSETPLDTMGDFVDPRHNLSGTKDLFVHAVRLLDVALLDYQSVDFLPSVLAGAALLLVDPSLDFLFVAQFLQLDPNVLWECKTWLYGLVYGISEWEARGGSQDRDRWTKVPVEELLFVQAHITIPSHLAYGLLRPESTPYPCGPACVLGNNQLLNCACHGSALTQYAAAPTMCASPSSSDNYGCLCKDGYHTCGSYGGGPHVYHFKYGWQGVDGAGLAYDANAPQEPMRYA
ncbi:hypothetical protein PybrP1_006778 [[Pythium] brassicae (nom. inval.)]|nr:hypothetical protein PybrP1_006778 [[Pythium] brassicae (nom. inval.)]